MEDNRKIYMLYNLKGTPFVQYIQVWKHKTVIKENKK